MTTEQLLYKLFEEHWLFTTIFFPTITIAYSWITDQIGWFIGSLAWIVTIYVVKTWK